VTDGAILKKVLITVGCCTARAVSEDREVGSIGFDEIELKVIAGYNYGRHFAVTSMNGTVRVFDVRRMVME
jgi:hypothetical protein